MFVKLDKAARDILCCPLCKAKLEEINYKFTCISCGMIYQQRLFGKGNNRGSVFDFRIHTPAYCKTVDMAKWSEIQDKYEKGDARRKRKDELEKYLEEIDSVKEIYTEQFHIKGSVLDVGGHQGRLRHFLSENDVPLYISIDPYLYAFQDIDAQPNLLKAYPCLLQPCNFLACYAENLPFKNRTFDWVHMRSALDHFHDPHKALIEAYRVLRNNGTILIGLTVAGGRSTFGLDKNKKTTYVSPVVPKILRLLKSLGAIKAAKYELKVFSAKPLGDHHMWGWQYENLLDLLHITNFTVTKEHWQKPPFTTCLYVAGKKQSLGTPDKTEQLV